MQLGMSKITPQKERDDLDPSEVSEEKYISNGLRQASAISSGFEDSESVPVVKPVPMTDRNWVLSKIVEEQDENEEHFG